MGVLPTVKAGRWISKTPSSSGLGPVRQLHLQPLVRQTAVQPHQQQVDNVVDIVLCQRLVEYDSPDSTLTVDAQNGELVVL